MSEYALKLFFAAMILAFFTAISAETSTLPEVCDFFYNKSSDGQGVPRLFTPPVVENGADIAIVARAVEQFGKEIIGRKIEETRFFRGIVGDTSVLSDWNIIGETWERFALLKLDKDPELAIRAFFMIYGHLEKGDQLSWRKGRGEWAIIAMSEYDPDNLPEAISTSKVIAFLFRDITIDAWQITEDPDPLFRAFIIAWFCGNDTEMERILRSMPAWGDDGKELNAAITNKFMQMHAESKISAFYNVSEMQFEINNMCMVNQTYGGKVRPASNLILVHKAMQPPIQKK
jgi:hypothetical protein